jgi:hypothetical protein
MATWKPAGQAFQATTHWGAFNLLQFELRAFTSNDALLESFLAKLFKPQ